MKPLSSGSWSSLPTQRTVLVAVHTTATVMRLTDIVTPLEEDSRVQLVYTQVPDRLGPDVARQLEGLGVRVLPWREATETSFDLAIAASPHQMEALPATRRFVAPHGSGYNKRWPMWAWDGPAETRPTYGLDRESLLDRDGRPIFDAIVLSHADQFDILTRQCPEAVPDAVVAGDPAFDRLLASLPFRERYRWDLGVDGGQILVAVTSTWGPSSLFCTQLHLLARLVTELPANHRVIMTVHPAVYAEHGARQVRAHLREFRRRGLGLVDEGEDWRGLVAAADVLIGDHTSVSVYGTAAGVPFLLSHDAAAELDPDSVMAELIGRSPRLRRETPLVEQFEYARSVQRSQQETAIRRISSVRGQSARAMRRTLYRLLNLAEPASPPRVEHVGTPRLLVEELAW